MTFKDLRKVFVGYIILYDKKHNCLLYNIYCDYDIKSNSLLDKYNNCTIKEIDCSYEGYNQITIDL